MSFPLGRSVGVLAVLAVATGAWQLAAPPATRADLTVWCFAESHARTFRDPLGLGKPSLLDLYQKRTGRSVGVELVNARALDARLLSLFATPAGAVPDVVEVEINSLGKYLRGPPDSVGFLPLNRFLGRDGLGGKLLKSRLAPWTKDGLIYGVPNDVHPVAIAYRKDLFDEAGVDLAASKTWPEYQAACLAFEKFWSDRGHPRRAMELDAASSDHLTLLLLQRGVNVVDAAGRCRLADPVVVETVAFYARLVAGPASVGGEASRGGTAWAGDLARGDLCAALCPDWRVADLKANAPDLAGKVALMPLPVFDPTDAPTATWGGTMLGIPKTARDPEASWSLLKFLLFSREGLAARRAFSDVLPPLRSAWGDPAYHQPDPFFGGQRAEELYVELAAKIPPRVQTPFTGVASAELTAVLVDAVAAVKRGVDGPALEGLIHSRLAVAQLDVERRIKFGTFE